MAPADLTLEALAASLPPSGALMGLDLGTKTIGLAISDHVEPAVYCLAPLEDAAHGRMLSNGSTSMKSHPVGTPGVTAATS